MNKGPCLGGQKDGNNISFGSVENVEMSELKQSATNGLKSSWASLFGPSTGNSLPYSPPLAVRDKIVVVPPDEVIVIGVKV